MAQTINTNVMSLNAQRNLSTSQASLATSMQRLSSGIRVNSARDDAAGLAVAERMSTQVRGMNVAIRNANDGISLAQTAESALGKMSESLQRMRELAVQSRNGTNSTVDQSYLQLEFSELQEELSRLITGSKFNGTPLFDATATSATMFQVGANEGELIDVPAASLEAAAPVDAATAFTAGAADADVITTAAFTYDGTNGIAIGSPDGTITVAPTNIDDALKVIDAALNVVLEKRAVYGAVQNRFEAVISNLQAASENQAAARGRIMDADFAQETSNLSRAQILQQAGTAMVAQANALPQQVLKLLQQ